MPPAGDPRSRSRGFRHSPIAGSFVLITKLNCIARKPRSRASRSEWVPMARATPCPRVGLGHVAASGHVSAAAGLIGAQIIGADDRAAFFRDKGFAVRSHPIGKRLGLGHVARQGVGFAFPDGRLEDAPNGAAIVIACRPDLHCCTIDHSRLGRTFPIFALDVLEKDSLHRRGCALRLRCAPLRVR